MARTITALRYYGPKDVRLDQVPVRPCGSDEVRLQIAYCGICGSDFHEYLGGPIFPPKAGERNPWTGEQLPVTLGHEMSGTVIEVGSSVTDPSAPGGGLASEIVVKHIACIPLPDSVSLQVGALMEPLAVAWHCIRTSGFEKGQTALVLGAGPIGLAILMLLRVWGAKAVVISEITASRKQLAKEFGAELVVDPTESTWSQDGTPDPVVAAVRATVHPDGVDAAFDATGLQTTLDTAIAAVRPGGTIFNVAIHEKPLQLNLNDLTLSEKRLTGGICYTEADFQGVLQTLEGGNVPAEKMITSIVGLEDVVGKGLLELIRNKAAHVKILIQPNQGRSARM